MWFFQYIFFSSPATVNCEYYVISRYFTILLRIGGILIATSRLFNIRHFIDATDNFCHICIYVQMDKLMELTLFQKDTVHPVNFEKLQKSHPHLENLYKRKIRKFYFPKPTKYIFF